MTEDRILTLVVVVRDNIQYVTTMLAKKYGVIK